MGPDFVKIWNFQFVSRITETIGTTDLELQGYIFMPPPLNRGVNIDLPVSVRLSVRPSLKSLCESGMLGHLCPMDTFLSFMYSNLSFL